MSKYRVTWKRTNKASAAPDWPVYTEVFEWAGDDIEQVPTMFRNHRFGSLGTNIEVLQIEKLA